ncbi:MAG: hypothetical protein ABI460_03530 [Caldimonas sp.]
MPGVHPQADHADVLREMGASVAAGALVDGQALGPGNHPAQAAALMRLHLL